MQQNNNEIMKFAHQWQVNVHALPRKGRAFSLSSNTHQRTLLAKNHGLVGVTSFDAHCHLLPKPSGKITLNGQFSANIIQKCIISGEDITSQITDHFTLTFTPEEPQLGKNNRKLLHEKSAPREIILDGYNLEEEEEEYFDGNIIDLGAVVEEFFCLALDPYPRKEGAQFSQYDDETAIDKPQSPFLALKKLQSS